MIEVAKEDEIQQQGQDSSSCSGSSCQEHYQQLSMSCKYMNDEMPSTNILIIDDQGLILSDNMSESNVLSSGNVIKNIEMIRWKEDHISSSRIDVDEEETSVGNSSGIPSQDETDVTSFEDSFSSFEAQLPHSAANTCDENQPMRVHCGYKVQKDEQVAGSDVDIMKLSHFSKVDTEKHFPHSSINPVNILLDSGCDSTTEIECSIDSESLYDCIDDDYDNDDDASDGKAKPTRRRVHFAVQVVTEKYETPCWTPEEKAFLFYTGKELHQFRLEHIIELYESQDTTKMDEWSKFEGRRSLRIFWSFYTVLLDFVTCKALTQYCCGGQRNLSEET